LRDDEAHAAAGGVMIIVLPTMVMIVELSVVPNWGITIRKVA